MGANPLCKQKVLKNVDQINESITTPEKKPAEIIHQRPIMQRIEMKQPDEEHSFYIIMKHYTFLMKQSDYIDGPQEHFTTFSHNHLHKTQDEFKKLIQQHSTKRSSRSKRQETRSLSSRIQSYNQQQLQPSKGILINKKSGISENIKFKVSKSVHFSQPPSKKRVRGIHNFPQQQSFS